MLHTLRVSYLQGIEGLWGQKSKVSPVVHALFPQCWNHIAPLPRGSSQLCQQTTRSRCKGGWGRGGTSIPRAKTKHCIMS